MVAGGGASVIYADTVTLNFLQILLLVRLHKFMSSSVNLGFIIELISYLANILS